MPEAEPAGGAALPGGTVIPRIINGCWQLSDGHRDPAPDPGHVLDDLWRLAEAGLTAFDCGDIYLGVEELLGQLLRRNARRSPPLPLRVHTKLVPDLEELPRISRARVSEIVDRSLRRLGVDELDMVQLAWWDYAVPRYVEAAGWLDELRTAGKVRMLGTTNFDVPRLREILDAGIPVAVHQVQYSLLDRRPERGMVELCRARGVGLVVYGALAGGFLSGRWRGRPVPGAPLANRSLVKYRLMIDELGGWDRHQDLLGCLARIAARHGVSEANVALRWVLDRPGVTAAIVGAADASHLEDNLRALALSLDAEDRALLQPFAGCGPPGDVYGVERDRGGPHGAIMRYDLNR